MAQIRYTAAELEALVRAEVSTTQDVKKFVWARDELGDPYLIVEVELQDPVANVQRAAERGYREPRRDGQKPTTSRT